MVFSDRIISMLRLTTCCRVLPEWLPFHPHRWWIHTRAVYLPMSYLYGVRFQAPENDLILSLRQVSVCACADTNQELMQFVRNSIPKTFIKYTGLTTVTISAKLIYMLLIAPSTMPSMLFLQVMNTAPSLPSVAWA